MLHAKKVWFAPKFLTATARAKRIITLKNNALRRKKQANIASNRRIAKRGCLASITSMPQTDRFTAIPANSIWELSINSYVRNLRRQAIIAPKTAIATANWFVPNFWTAIIGRYLLKSENARSPKGQVNIALRIKIARAQGASGITLTPDQNANNPGAMRQRTICRRRGAKKAESVSAPLFFII